ncbi:MAG TPA: alanine racemase [Candidatus Cloacimonadota bacterium]|nr:alanine racemase [Candidatus Cloacimonadota bacterium]HPS38919.1 alanine racemase [Candidatus Cloacimonadota bacterium]
MLNNISERSWVEIDLDTFRANLRELKRLLSAGQLFMQIVKADAYGHGALEISKIALDEGAVMLGVANLEEGKLLRLQGITAPILILSPALVTEIDAILEYNLTVTISDIGFGNELNKVAIATNRSAKAHLKLDTGMHRSGITRDMIPSLISVQKDWTNIAIEGVFSHFAASEADTSFSQKQLREYLDILSALPFKPKYTHIANSSGLAEQLCDGTNLVRLGILSYGIYTSEAQIQRIRLEPVMTFKASLSQLKTISAGEALGYNLTWKATSDTRYGIIPVGYADGYDYLLANKGLVSVRGTLCPIIGKISMDMITADLSHVPDAAIGDEVVLLGKGDRALRAEQICGLYQGLSYELLCQIGRRAKRYYFKDGQLVSSSPLSRRDFVPGDFSDTKLSDIIETAVSQRLGSEEIGSLVYREMLSHLFSDHDQAVHYRRDFEHCIEFSDMGDSDHYLVATTLNYTKILDNNYFIVACANREDVLNKYFQRRDVEYRWLMDQNFALSERDFRISSIQVNGIDLDTRINVTEGCLEIYCTHPELENIVGREVQFSINTITRYPKKSHQLSVFITEMTRGVEITFRFPLSSDKVECIPIYSGQSKYPQITRYDSLIRVSTEALDWIFPVSGVVFAY